MIGPGESKARRLIPILLIVFSTTHSSAWAENSVFAHVNHVEGTARNKAPGSEGWVAIDSSSTIAFGDSVRTLEKSEIEILRNGGNVIRLGPNTLVTVTDSATAPDESTGAFELISGDLWSVWSGQNRIKSQLLTPRAAIRGRAAVARCAAGDDGSTEIKVYKGALEISRRSVPAVDTLKQYEADTSETPERTQPEAWTLTLETGGKLIISAHGDIAFNGRFSPDDRDEQTEWVRRNMNKDLEPRD